MLLLALVPLLSSIKGIAKIIPRFSNASFSLFHGKWCERLYQMMWEIIPNNVRDYTNDVRDYTKWCERLYQMMLEIIQNNVRDYTK